jgi:exosortase/archaeosortase family protein
MQLYLKTKSILNTIPTEIRTFLIRAGVIFITWKLLYHLLLFPTRFPDKQLTQLTAAATSIVYTTLNNNTTAVYRETVKPGRYNKNAVVSVAVIYINNKRGIGIADGCNGLELYVLYIGFLFCFPFHLKRKLIYTLFGICGIFIMNTLRCYGLTYLFLHNYSIAEFAHHYLFKIIIYAAIFFTWTKYAKPQFSKIY